MFLSFFTLPVRAWPRVAGDVAPRQWAWILVKDMSWRIWVEKDEIMKQEQAETEGASSVTQTPKRMFGSKNASWEQWMQQNPSQGFHKDTERSCARKEHFGSPRMEVRGVKKLYAFPQLTAESAEWSSEPLPSLWLLQLLQPERSMTLHPITAWPNPHATNNTRNKEQF